MTPTIQLLDVVALTADLPAQGLLRGQVVDSISAGIAADSNKFGPAFASSASSGYDSPFCIRFPDRAFGPE
ncbi:MAG TPA: hypothetical protein VFC78_18995 [Tepidisphaeraceae bacterium]|nr:hypothetical protein [Tepidisphaeraceae bacterium]